MRFLCDFLGFLLAFFSFFSSLFGFCSSFEELFSVLLLSSFSFSAKSFPRSFNPSSPSFSSATLGEILSFLNSS